MLIDGGSENRVERFLFFFNIVCVIICCVGGGCYGEGFNKGVLES